MTHRAEDIMVAVLAKVTGLATTGANVSRGRSQPVETVPALTLEQGEDSIPDGINNLAVVDRALSVRVIAYVKSNTQFDTALNLIREEVYAALMSDRTQGLSNIVLDTYPMGDDEPEISGDAEKNIGRQVINFEIHYRHSLTNAGA